MTYTINTNEKYNSLEISFSEKPNTQTRNILKSLKFRWNPTKGIWYGYSTSEVLQEALNMEEQAPKKQLAKEEVKTEVTYTDGYMGAIEMTGCNYSLSNDVADINKLVKKEIKRAFPMFKTKTSLKRYSGGRSISFTLFVDSSYLKSDDELIEVLADHYCRYPRSWYLDYSINDDSTFEEVKTAVTRNLDQLKKKLSKNITGNQISLQKKSAPR